jgi:hypothetical protein
LASVPAASATSSSAGRNLTRRENEGETENLSPEK